MQTLPDERRADFLVIGAGVAAASVAYWLAPHARVLLLERESQPGYHSTGRSAALFMASYGTPQVRALSLASRAFLEHPPEGFTEHPLLSPRGALMVAQPGQEVALDRHWDVLRSITPDARRLDRAQTCAMVPVLRPERVAGSVYESDASDMDVHAIHQGYLRGVRHAGGPSAVCWRRAARPTSWCSMPPRWRTSSPSSSRSRPASASSGCSSTANASGTASALPARVLQRGNAHA